MADPTRRRFLGWLAAVFGTAAAGGGSWWAATRNREPVATVAPPAASGPDPAGSTSRASPPEAQATPSTTTAHAPAPAATTAAPAPSPAAPSGAVGAPEIIARAGWDARPIQGEFVAHTIERMTVHHTAELLEDPSQAPARLRRHQRYHQDEKGWPDIAYHFVIDSAGRVFEGRPLWASGDTATMYDPTGHLLVCCEADFDRQSPTGAQLESLVSMLAWGAVEFGVDPDTIKGHRDYAATSCPGGNLAALIDDGTIEALVRARL
jgi:hypothetical protein